VLGWWINDQQKYVFKDFSESKKKLGQTIKSLDGDMIHSISLICQLEGFFKQKLHQQKEDKLL